MYRERNEQKRLVFNTTIKSKRAEDIVWIDECGMNDDEVPDSAYGPKGPRIMAEKNGHKKMRLTIISALNQNILQVPATFYFEGHCTRELFEIYIEKILVPNLKPGQTVVFDNASFHKGGRIENLIQSAGCSLEYLPPYSPDLNPIEHFWFALKTKIRKALLTCKNDLFQATQLAFDNMCHVN